MIIGINAAKAAVKNRTGVENVVFEVILNLLKIDSKNTYLLYTNQPLPEELLKNKNAKQILIKSNRAWNKIFLPFGLLLNKPDIFVQPLDSIPAFAPKKSVAIVHDLAFKYFPAAYSEKGLKDQNNSLDNITDKAAKIICVSEATKNDLLKYYKNTKEKAEVAYLGFNSKTFHPVEKFNNPLKIDAPYILYVGRIESKKNTLRLIQAFTKLKEEKGIPHKLVLVGGPGYGYDKIYEEISSSRFMNDIILPGHINHDRLPELIAASDVFAFPTLYEGFGLPIIEAMACGATVVASNSSCLPEIGGDAAIYVDPLKVDDIAEGIYYFIQHPEIKERYQKLGIKRAEYFSWEKTAEKILKVLENS